MVIQIKSPSGYPEIKVKKEVNFIQYEIHIKYFAGANIGNGIGKCKGLGK